MNVLQQISEDLFNVIDSGMLSEHVVSNEPFVLQWENEMGIFRFDNDKQTIFIQPKTCVQKLDMKITILPSGAIFNEEI